MPGSARGQSTASVGKMSVQLWRSERDIQFACTKCNNRFQTEPYQLEKTNAFLHFLMSVKLKSAEIEYKDMITYVDTVLKFKGDE